MATREEVALFNAYEAENTRLRQTMTQLYRQAGRQLDGWTQFQADLQPGGRFETLAAQYASDTSDVNDAHYATLIGALMLLRSTVEAMEADTPGLFNIGQGWPEQAQTRRARA
jgi:hypothetical protein